MLRFTKIYKVGAQQCTINVSKKDGITETRQNLPNSENSEKF